MHTRERGGDIARAYELLDRLHPLGAKRTEASLPAHCVAWHSTRKRRLTEA
jgi:hypothetical protein